MGTACFSGANSGEIQWWPHFTTDPWRSLPHEIRRPNIESSGNIRNGSAWPKWFGADGRATFRGCAIQVFNSGHSNLAGSLIVIQPFMVVTDYERSAVNWKGLFVHSDVILMHITWPAHCALTYLQSNSHNINITYCFIRIFICS